jgi:3-dehydroquinate synthase
MILRLDLPQGGYDIVLERGVLQRVGEWFPLDRKVLIVTDNGVPTRYAEAVAKACRQPVVMTVPQGETSKSFAMLERVCARMLSEGFTRTDCIVAVGGGVVGDLAGFAAATYMRGIDFYNIPTTLLAQVDSSIGGKVAVNLDGVKNIVGAFYQPKGVLIDPDVLITLPERQIANGLAEALKMSLTCDRELFALLESGMEMQRMEEVIEGSLRIKKAVVEKDEKESGLRKILNFGHTLGHGIESEAGLHGLYHGECVALGMLPMCADRVRERLIPVLERMGLPTRIDGDLEKMLEAASHDKKCNGTNISVVWVERVGSCELREMTVDAWKQQIRAAMAQIGKD